MKYIYITYDAIRQFVSSRQLQSVDYSESEDLCLTLKGECLTWPHFRNTYIYMDNNPNGIIFFTKSINKNRGLIFDLGSFDGFNTNNNDKILSIFQKTLKYAIKYFDRLPLTNSERIISSDISIVYPFPFSPTKDAYKILIDKNSNKISSRKGKDILTAYYSGTKGEPQKAQFTNLRKALEDIENVIINDTNEEESSSSSLNITDLEKIDLTIDSRIGFENWNYYLTEKQKKFINLPIGGPERLEGAAGTGKTLTMVLRCINIIKQKIANDERYPIVFITHSLSSKNHIIEIFKNNYPDIINHMSNEDEIRYLLVITLQEWCIKYLGAYIAETEYLDKDAKDSKILQSMYIEEAYSKVMENDFESYQIICSQRFIDFLKKTNRELLIEMLQFEIAIIIKGRANGDFDKYKKIDRPQYSIPCESPNDLSFLYLIYQKYQESLETIGQYDSDDIILTALGQLNTPIWKRRRSKEGFQASFIDEAQLFNLNELSVFHYLNAENAKNNIVFAIDKAQAVGERNISNTSLFEALGINEDQQENHRFNTVFRSSPDIINLAYNILSSGATLFTNMENPLDSSSVNFTAEEEKKSFPPTYLLCSNDEKIIKQAFIEAESYVRDHDILKSKILIATTNEYLLHKIEVYSDGNHKPVEILKSRGDSTTINKAASNNKYVIGGIDYVGGLEFDKVIIIGVDKGRVPSSDQSEHHDSYHFTNYAWHNRMYVAITRAKYSLVMIGEKSRGRSQILESAIYYKYIKVTEVD